MGYRPREIPSDQPSLEKRAELPDYNDAETFCFEWCRQSKDNLYIGRLRGYDMRLRCTGHLLCEGHGTSDIYGEGTLIYDGKEMTCQIIGSLLARGTAVILDKEGKIWLYTPANAVDWEFEGVEAKLELIKKKGEEEIAVGESLQDAKWVNDDDESDDDY
jgi:hypothetical protein